MLIYFIYLVNVWIFQNINSVYQAEHFGSKEIIHLQEWSEKYLSEQLNSTKDEEQKFPCNEADHIVIVAKETVLVATTSAK